MVKQGIKRKTNVLQNFLWFSLQGSLLIVAHTIFIILLIQRYYQLLEYCKQQETSFEQLARQLYAIDNGREFPFLTKTLHTLNINRSIYGQPSG